MFCRRTIEILQRSHIFTFLPPAGIVCEVSIFTGLCLFTGGGVYPRMPCRSHDQPTVYKQLRCWWVSVGVEAAYRQHQIHDGIGHMASPGQTPRPGRHPPHTVNKRTVRIPLDCFPVKVNCCLKDSIANFVIRYQAQSPIIPERSGSDTLTSTFPWTIRVVLMNKKELLPCAVSLSGQ